jgi:NADPH:quinone reductase-like Zn-dependent oxidoreductase
MKAAVINKFGSSDVFGIDQNFPDPILEDNQVMVKMRASGINPLDWKTRQGMLKPILGSKFPMLLGNDGAGEIISCGSKVTQFKEGDSVYGMFDSAKKLGYYGFAKTGTYATLAVTREDTLSLIPKNISFTEAATVPLCALTAYQALVKKSNIKPGDKVLINGASGGVGIFAVQIAKARGAEVTAVCSTANIEKLQGFNIDHFVDYSKTDISELKDRFDLIYDVAANRKFSKTKKMLSSDGIFISNLAPPIIFVFPGLRKIRKTGKSAFTWVEPSGKDLKEISKLIESETITPVVDKNFSLDEISAAHEYCEKGKIFGKVAVSIS